MEITEQQLEIIEKAKHGIEQLSEISRVCLLYNKGASAEACMERIQKIITEESNL